MVEVRPATCHSPSLPLPTRFHVLNHPVCPDGGRGVRDHLEVRQGLAREQLHLGAMLFYPEKLTGEAQWPLGRLFQALVPLVSV